MALLGLRSLKRAYDLLGNDRFRACTLKALELARFRKDIVRMDTNDVCNIQCVFCSNRPQRCTPDRYMPFDSYRRLIDAMAGHTRMLYLSCGYEPLMTPQFGRYISYAKRKNIPFISFATNALLLDRNGFIEELVEEQVDEVIVSFNGFDKSDYERLMYRSRYDRVVRNLEKLSDYKRRKNSARPAVRLNTILLASNLMKLDKLVEFVEQYDVDVVQFRPLGVWEGQNNPAEVAKEVISSLSPKELADIGARLKSYCLKLAQKGKRIIAPVSLLQGGHIPERSLPRPRSRTSCSVPYFSYWITYTGEVRVCPCDMGSVLGNIFHTPREEMRNRRDLFRRKALRGDCLGSCTTNIEASTLL